MSFVVNKEDFESVLKRVSKFSKNKTTLPALSHIAIRCHEGQVTMMANDGVRSYCETIQAETENCAFTLLSEKLLKAVSVCRSGDLKVSPKGLASKSWSVYIESLPFSSFPDVLVEDLNETDLTGSELSSAISVVSHAMPVKDYRQELNGVFIGAGRAVATDGIRMAFEEIRYNGAPVIIPSETTRLIAGIDGKVLASPRQLAIVGERSRFTTSIIDKRYPDAGKVVPSDYLGAFEFSSDDALSALRLVEIGGENATLEFSQSGCRVYNKGASAEFCATGGGIAKWSVKIQFLIDAIKASGEKKTSLMIPEGKRPAKVNKKFHIMPVVI